MEAEAGAGFDEGCPILAVQIERRVSGPERLHFDIAEDVGIAEFVLRIVDHIIVEVADEDAVGRGFKEPATVLRRNGTANRFGIINASTIVAPARSVQITDRRTRFGPSHRAMPLAGCNASAQYEGALGKTLGDDTAGVPSRIAHKTNGKIRPERQVFHAHFGLELRVAEHIVPARGIERIGPEREAKTRVGGVETLPGAAGFIRHGVVGTVARDIEPVERSEVVVKKVVRPAELQCDSGIERIGLAGQRVIA